MWLAGLPALVMLLENVGVLVWHDPQSPVAGWILSSEADGRESPATPEVLAIIP
jgi:hypothetical protein